MTVLPQTPPGPCTLDDPRNPTPTIAGEASAPTVTPPGEAHDACVGLTEPISEPPCRSAATTAAELDPAAAGSAGSAGSAATAFPDMPPPPFGQRGRARRKHNYFTRARADDNPPSLTRTTADEAPATPVVPCIGELLARVELADWTADYPALDALWAVAEVFPSAGDSSAFAIGDPVVELDADAFTSLARALPGCVPPIAKPATELDAEGRTSLAPAILHVGAVAPGDFGPSTRILCSTSKGGRPTKGAKDVRGDVIRAWREELGLTQQKVARLLGISVRTVNRLEDQRPKGRNERKGGPK